MDVVLGTVSHSQVEKRLIHLLRHSVMSKEEPEAKDGLREDVKNSVRDNLSIDIGDAGSIGNTPDT